MTIKTIIEEKIMSLLQNEMNENWSKGSSNSYVSDAKKAIVKRKLSDLEGAKAAKLGKDHPDYKKHMANCHKLFAQHIKHSYHSNQWGSQERAKKDYKEHMIMSQEFKD